MASAMAKELGRQQSHQSKSFVFLKFPVRSVNNVYPCSSQKTVPTNVSGIAFGLGAIYFNGYQLLSIPETVINSEVIIGLEAYFFC
jgi:hypothetical protein